MGILKAVIFKHVEMRDQIKREYHRKTTKLLETKLHSRDLIKGINTRAVALLRYLGLFTLNVNEKRSSTNTPEKKKCNTIQNVSNSRDDVDRLYVLRKGGGRVLASIENSVVVWIQRLEEYMKKHRVD